MQLKQTTQAAQWQIRKDKSGVCVCCVCCVVCVALDEN